MEIDYVERITRDFTYHPPTEEQKKRYDEITEASRRCALIFATKTPRSPEQTLALRALQQARMWANCSIAVNEADQAQLSTDPNTLYPDVLLTARDDDPEIKSHAAKIIEKAKRIERLAEVARDLLRSTPDHELPLEYLQLKQQLGQANVLTTAQPTPAPRLIHRVSFICSSCQIEWYGINCEMPIALNLVSLMSEHLGEDQPCSCKEPDVVLRVVPITIGEGDIQKVITKEQLDAVYTERNLCVALIAQMAHMLGLHVGIKNHQGAEWEDEWRNVLFIDLPRGGQISWHLHQRELPNFPDIGPYLGTWDGHSTEEKYDRLKKFIQMAAPQPLPEWVHQLMANSQDIITAMDDQGNVTTHALGSDPHQAATEHIQKFKQPLEISKDGPWKYGMIEMPMPEQQGQAPAPVFPAFEEEPPAQPHPNSTYRPENVERD